jgi:hypothetical protein
MLSTNLTGGDYQAGITSCRGHLSTLIATPGAGQKAKLLILKEFTNEQK